jgi:hypothetical protein
VIKSYFNSVKETLLYFDFQPLLFFWVVSDFLNNQVLWTNLSYWESVGQANTYWLYFAYLFGSIGMLISINDIKWLSRFISYYLILYLFSTIRYLVSVYTTVDTEPFTMVDFKNILITCWYAFMWIWVLFKLKKEMLNKSMRYE